jgi:hypothetical protein
MLVVDKLDEGESLRDAMAAVRPLVVDESPGWTNTVTPYSLPSDLLTRLSSG